ncbi:hypothetical protein [Actinoplanes sp. HUAS TT8]|uniref:hypothetical protein n=1 Tax=Actinoplanes sp. HUAS TT8 TaxID=3447453 RepID=UPI003F528FFF
MDLEDWVQGIQPRLAGLEAADLEIDFGRGSLAALQGLAIGAENEEFLAACASYLGETLLRAAGGRWVEVGDRPGVAADPALGLDPVVPAELLEFEGLPVGTYDEWAAAVAVRQAAEPDWRPVKEPTPGLDRQPAGDRPVEAQVEDWLAERAADFPRWVARWAPDQVWDFSPESLDRLAELLLELLGSGADVDDPAFRDPVEGAEWYLGETFLRAGGGRWIWHDGSQGRAGRYLEDVGPEGLLQVPIVQLGMGMSTPGYLSEQCEELAG